MTKVKPVLHSNC